MHPRVQWVCSLGLHVCTCARARVCVYKREHTRMGGQVCEYVYLHTCVCPGMTNKTLLLTFINIKTPICHSGELLEALASSPPPHQQTHALSNNSVDTTDGSTYWWKTSRDTSITWSITIDHSVKIRGHKGGRTWNKGIFCMKHAENIGALCRIGISSRAITN